MANTIIQIKRSTANAAPTSLANSELAYSFNSNKLFIGNNGTVIEIGGKSTVDNAIAARARADAAAIEANNYSNVTFVKLTAPTQTITGDISVTGNLNIQGITTTIGTQNLVVNDPIIILANNNTTDITDIGVISRYANAAGNVVHTGLMRDHTTKGWYLFKEYNDVSANTSNNINIAANNFTIDTLTANLITNNLTLGGANAIVRIDSAFDKANNALKNTTDTFTGTLTITGDLIATGNVTFDTTTLYVSATSNSVGIGTITPTSNLHVIGTANITSNLVAGNVTVAGALVVGGTNITTAINDGLASSTNASNLTVGTVPTGRMTGPYTGITGLGTLTLGTWNANTITVQYGGTGRATLTANSVLLGNGTGGILSTSGTDGQVLQSDQGVPKFAMLDGGLF